MVDRWCRPGNDERGETHDDRAHGVLSAAHERHLKLPRRRRARDRVRLRLRGVAILDPGTKFSDTVWTDGLSGLQRPVTVWNGHTVTGLRQAGKTANRHRVVVGTAIPTADTWAVDDELLMDVAAPGKPVAYRCITAGTPGTWRPIAQTVGKATTGSRPTLTASDIGVMYMDTTLEADGKPIWWQGTKWIDATGADA